MLLQAGVLSPNTIEGFRDVQESHSLHCLDNTGCEADRSVGGDSSWRFACLFQRENGGFLPDSGHNTFGEALVEDG